MGEAAASPQSFRNCKFWSNTDEELPRTERGPYLSVSQRESRGDPAGDRMVHLSIKGKLQALSPMGRVLQVRDPVCFYSYFKIITLFL